MADAPASLSPQPDVTAPSSRTALLGTLASIAAMQAAAQFDACVVRLANALTQPSEAVQGDEARIARDASLHLVGNKTTFQRLLAAALDEVLRQEIAASEAPPASRVEREAMDLSLASFEAMELRVLIDDLSQAIAAANAQQLEALDRRIAHLLGCEDPADARNPFRPETFVKAMSDAWSGFDLNPASHRVVLRRLKPEVFLQFDPILWALNQALAASGILPDMVDAFVTKEPAKPPPGASVRRSLPLYRKLDRLLPPSEPGTAAISAALADVLAGLQERSTRPDAPRQDAALIRQVRQQAPRGSLARADENAIELLARMFDFVFRERHVPAEAKELLGRLQLPVLKAALADKEFFFEDSHPARRLVEAIAGASVALEEGQCGGDPLYLAMEQAVERVCREGEPFGNAAASLDAFLAEESRQSAAALLPLIEEGLRQERLQRAKELAANDVALRLETGEVSGFVEVVLEQQWVRVLGLAHSMADSKPEVLRNVQKAMDDLIWSIRPKARPEERKELLTRLPALLALLNHWLDVVKWNGPQRTAFFSALAERHAAVVRTQTELSPRQQLEITMNIVERASERRLNKRASEHAQMAVDEFVHMVDALEPGAWLAFTNGSGAQTRYRLAWISPGRSRFLFAGRTGQQALLLSFDQLVQTFRHGRAAILAADLVLGRAVTALLEGL